MRRFHKQPHQGKKLHLSLSIPCSVIRETKSANFRAANSHCMYVAIQVKPTIVVKKKVSSGDALKRTSLFCTHVVAWWEEQT